ncbi:MAG: MBL fold metallo-hydrolase [Candidatus Latescibacteria bacterium]|nr:MBL fold metallo-hydrolase [Candidatus Latescibacterota bacterium]
MLIKSFNFSVLETICYLVADEKSYEALVIDCNIRTQKEKELLYKEIREHNLQLKYIINTHHHIDHTSGNALLKKEFGAQILIHELDALVLPEQWQWFEKTHNIMGEPLCDNCKDVKLNLKIMPEQKKVIIYCDKCGFKYEIFPSPPADRLLRNNNIIKLGDIEFKVMHTPGHSPGGICLYSEKEHVLFSGDTLFALSKGRTDMFDGSEQDMKKSLKELMKLPEDTVVYPGHMGLSTIGKEKKENPYVLGIK